MSMDIAMLRADTPACSNLIHFNNAGAALTPRPVQQALIEHLQLEQRIGGYEAAVENDAVIENFYHAFAALLNCHYSEIAFAENATHAWNNLLAAIVFTPGDIILTGQSEYASNYLNFLHLAKRKGVKIQVIANDANGLIDLHAFTQALNDKVKLIALTHVPSQSGVIHPAQEIGRLARQHGILYLLDACQSAGQIALDVEQIACDMLTGTGRKYLRGPRGTGFAYVRASCMHHLQPAWVDLHSVQWTSKNAYRLRDDARQFENWECFIAGKIALGRAVDYALELGLEKIEWRVQQLAAQLRAALTRIPNVRVHEHGAQLSGIVTFDKIGTEASRLHAQLRAHAINTSVLRIRSSQLDLSERQLPDINRASVHYYNSEEEIARFCHVLHSI